MGVRLVVSNILDYYAIPHRSSVVPVSGVRDTDSFAPDNMAWFWGGDDRLVVTRRPLPPEFMEVTAEIMGYRNVVNMSPPGADRLGLTDALLSTPGVDLIGQWCEQQIVPDEVDLISWGPTASMTSFSASLKSRLGNRIRGLCDQRIVTVADYLDSKRGSRDLFELRGPDSVDAEVIPSFSFIPSVVAAELVRALLGAAGPLIVKAEYGAGGHGILIIRNEADVDAHMRELEELQRAGSILERYLGDADDVIPIAYNGVIDDKARVVSLSVGKQVVVGDQFFMGSEMGVGCVSLEIEARVRRAAETVAMSMADLGFRGFFNVDFLYQSDGERLFFGEINPRRSGSLTIHDMGRKLFGDDFAERVAVRAVERFKVRDNVTSFKELARLLAGARLLGRTENGACVVPYIVESLATDGNVGVAVFGATMDEVGEIFSDLTSLVGGEPSR